MNHLSLYADPLGDLYVEWKISTSEAIEINLPHYKYEMSKVLSIPVPFSSMAEKLQCEVFKVCETDELENKVEYFIRNDFKGSNNLVVPNLAGKERTLLIQYVVRGIVTQDKVFFNFVFSLNSPIRGQLKTDMDLTAKFAYDINSYKLKAAIISKITGRIVGRADMIEHSKSGDFITAKGRSILLGEDAFDLHVHASRLPMMIDRRIFWLIIFIIAVVGVGTILSLFKLK